MKKEKKKLVKKDTIVRIMCVLLLIVIIIIAIYYVKKINTQKTEEHIFYQYIGEEKNIYKGVLEISQQEGITQLKSKDVDIVLDSTPVYYNDIPNKVIFPQNMAIVFPLNNGQMKKVNMLSNCIKEQESIYIEYNEQKTLIGHGFLYDGVDLYFFLEEIKIVIGEEEYIVPPLSYAYVSYNQYVELYNKESDMVTIIDVEGKPVTAKTEDYEINMDVDSMRFEEKEQLLLKKIDLLEKL